VNPGIWKLFLNGKHLSDLNKIISPRQKKIFINNIFRSNPEDYYRIVKLINILPTWTQAAKLLSLCFREREIDPNSELAMQFSNLVYFRYFPKEIQY